MPATKTADVEFHADWKRPQEDSKCRFGKGYAITPHTPALITYKDDFRLLGGQGKFWHERSHQCSVVWDSRMGLKYGFRDTCVFCDDLQNEVGLKMGNTQT